MIKLCNLRNEQPSEPYDIVVDRTSILRNPFKMNSELERKIVCDKYRNYFNEKVKDRKSQFYKELERLVALYNQYGKLRLFCWCFPQMCHSETIKEYLDKKVERRR